MRADGIIALVSVAGTGTGGAPSIGTYRRQSKDYRGTSFIEQEWKGTKYWHLMHQYQWGPTTLGMYHSTKRKEMRWRLDLEVPRFAFSRWEYKTKQGADKAWDAIVRAVPLQILLEGRIHPHLISTRVIPE